MSISDRLKTLLDHEGTDYEVLEHPQAFTAQEEAAATHVPGQNWAKTVVVKADDRYVLAVLPATRQLDLDALAEAVGAQAVALADEDEFDALYPDCEPGAMPPFGHLYQQTTVVDRSLAEDEYIVFHAGDHRTAVKLPYRVYQELESPEVASLSAPG